MSDAIDRALSENHALIAAILEHHSSGRHVPAVALLERLQLNLEFIAALSEHGLPSPSPSSPPNPQPADTSGPRPSSAPARIAPALPVPVTSPPVGTMYWTPEEHARFEEGMRLYGSARDGKPNFKAIASFVGTRTPVQVRSHLQKVQKRARKDAEENQGNQTSQAANPHDQTPSQVAQQVRTDNQVASQAISLPSASLPSASLPSASLPSASLPSASLPSTSLPSASLPSASLPSASLPTGNLATASLQTANLPARNQAQGT